MVSQELSCKTRLEHVAHLYAHIRKAVIFHSSISQRVVQLLKHPSLPLEMASVAKTPEEATAKIEDLIKSNKVVVFSKSYCPYCDKVKDLFKKLSAQFYGLELDEIGQEGSLLQAALKTRTGQSTVPNVFINGNHIGGCDDTFRLHRNSKLVPLLK
ncbi:unnamed protein product [Allacma fusca]|uniref:Glutaredoxin domain-containing protein n=1 Tax=Allacma fusca TaxID=39272 RepID=A0A8J2PK19_9HEXA|nr:unnamed protein product [Allacma fusca]